MAAFVDFNVHFGTTWTSADHHESDFNAHPLCRCSTSSSTWLTATGSGPSRSCTRRGGFSREERHRDALAPGDLALVFVALTREFVGRAELKTTFLDPMPSDPATSGPAVSGVLLGDVEDWTSGVPLDVAVQRIDPNGSNPYVQANAAGFRAGVVQITFKEFDIVVSLHDRARDVAE